MSFYTQDDDDDFEDGGGGGGFLSGGSQQQQSFFCANCGNTDCYTDDTTGALVCTSCFTQSQDIQQEELDFEEVTALAAKTRDGRFIGHRRSMGNPGGGIGRFQNKKRKPYTFYDTSRRPPSLQQCLEGYQQVLKDCVRRIRDDILADHNNNNNNSDDEDEDDDMVSRTLQDMETTVKRLWLAYLRAWREAAEFYGKYHPEVRFSLRDSFLRGQKSRSTVLSQLSWKAQTELEQEAKRKQPPASSRAKKRTKRTINQDSNDTDKEEGEDAKDADDEEADDSSDDDDDDNDESHNDHTRKKKLGRRRDTMSKVRQVVALYRRRGRREMALLTTPNLLLVASFLCVPLSRLGYTGWHVVEWIAQGRLPLLNAYACCLTPELRDALQPIHLFFRLERLPIPNGVECNARILLFIANGGGSAAVDDGDGNKKKKKKKKINNPLTSTMLWIPSTVPLVMARMVSDTGLGQRVLDLAFALMGMDKPASPGDADRRFPLALSKARPELLNTKAKMVAVLLVACQLCPGWETWRFGRRRRRTPSTKAANIPWNDAQVHRVDNLDEYVRYMEVSKLFIKDKDLPEFLMDNENEHEQDSFQHEMSPNGSVEDDDTDDDDTEVVAGVENPHQPVVRHRRGRRSKNHEWHCRVHRRKALWSEANGFGKMVVYDPRNNHNKHLGLHHAHFLYLVEYLAYMTDTAAKDVLRLTLELQQCLRPPEKGKTKKPRRRKKVQQTKDAEKEQEGDSTSLKVTINGVDECVGETAEV